MYTLLTILILLQLVAIGMAIAWATKRIVTALHLQNRLLALLTDTKPADLEALHEELWRLKWPVIPKRGGPQAKEPLTTTRP